MKHKWLIEKFSSFKQLKDNCEVFPCTSIKKCYENVFSSSYFIFICFYYLISFPSVCQLKNGCMTCKKCKIKRQEINLLKHFRVTLFLILSQNSFTLQISDNGLRRKKVFVILFSFLEKNVFLFVRGLSEKDVRMSITII